MATTENNWQKIRLVSTVKQLKDMTATVPSSWNGEKITGFYKTFHKQNNDAAFPKSFNLLLLGKSLSSDVKISDILNGRVLANEIKIYVLPDRSGQAGAARPDASNLKNLSPAEQEAVHIVEANQGFALLSEYIGSLLAAYDPVSQAETRQIILRNFPLMDPKIQALVLKCSKFYGAAYDNPFVDHNIHRLMEALGIQPQARDKQAIKDLFRRPDNERREPLPERVEGNAEEGGERQNRPQVNQFIQEIEDQLNRQRERINPGAGQGDAQANRVGNFIRDNFLRIAIGLIALASLLVFRDSASILWVIVGVFLLQRMMNLLGMLRNIPVDPVVQRALEAHPQEPLARGVKAWFLSMAELITTFLLSISPGWNIDVYVRVVYHSWFRRAINDIVHRRQEEELIRQDELARQARLRPDEIEEEEKEDKRESGGSEEWPEDENFIKERKPREMTEEKSPELKHGYRHAHREDDDSETNHQKAE